MLEGLLDLYMMIGVGYENLRLIMTNWSVNEVVCCKTMIEWVNGIEIMNEMKQTENN